MTKLRVLLVEDDREYIDFLASVCSRHGFDPKGVVSFAAARVEVERRAYDVVVTDMCARDDSAIDFVWHVRSVQPGSVVLGMTLGGAHARVYAADLCGHLAKPFHDEELIFRITALAGARARSGQSPELPRAPATRPRARIDPRSRR